MEAEYPVEDLPGRMQAELESVFLDNRSRLLAFVKQRGAVDEEDVLHDMWLKLHRVSDPAQTIAMPLAYLFRMANSILIDRYHQRRTAERRQMRWLEQTEESDPAATPAADRVAEGRDTVTRVLALIEAQGERVSRVFRRHRLDGLTQREVAAEIGVSLSTVEGDLRQAYRALADFRTADHEV